MRDSVVIHDLRCAACLYTDRHIAAMLLHAASVRQQAIELQSAQAYSMMTNKLS